MHQNSSGNDNAATVVHVYYIPVWAASTQKCKYTKVHYERVFKIECHIYTYKPRDLADRGNG